jgi:hypothetical protein
MTHVHKANNKLLERITFTTFLTFSFCIQNHYFASPKTLKSYLEITYREMFYSDLSKWRQQFRNEF